VKVRVISFAVAFAALAVLLGGCATTSMLSSWVDPEAAGKKLDKVLVIGIAKNHVVRRQYEDTFVRQLTAKGARAIPSYQLLPDANQISEESIAPHIAENQITQVLVTRLVDRKTVSTYVPPTTTMYATGYPSYYPSYYGSWYGYYNTGYAAVSSPGYTYDTEYVNLETNVYDIAAQKLVWTGLTETELGGQVDAQIDEFIQLLTATMSRDKLL